MGKSRTVGEVNRARAVNRMVKQANRLRDVIVQIHWQGELAWTKQEAYVGVLRHYGYWIHTIAAVDPHRVAMALVACRKQIEELSTQQELPTQAGEPANWPEHLEKKIWEVGLRHLRLCDQGDFLESALGIGAGARD